MPTANPSKVREALKKAGADNTFEALKKSLKRRKKN